MNEQVETIYAQMFAPEPVPQKVKDLFEKVNFYLNRIDSPQLHPRELAILPSFSDSSNTSGVRQVLPSTPLAFRVLSTVYHG